MLWPQSFAVYFSDFLGDFRSRKYGEPIPDYFLNYMRNVRYMGLGIELCNVHSICAAFTYSFLNYKLAGPLFIGIIIIIVGCPLGAII